MQNAVPGWDASWRNGGGRQFVVAKGDAWENKWGVRWEATREARRLRRERKRTGSGDRDEGKRKVIVSGAHTGVGLDSFIGARSTARSERKRGRKRDWWTGRAGGGRNEGWERRRWKRDGKHTHTRTYTWRRKREPYMAQFGTNGKNETHRESVRNQFAMHYAIPGHSRLPA